MKVFVPGRVLLVGDHSDWVGSFNRGIDTMCIEALVNKGVYAKISKSDRFEFYFLDRSYTSELDPVKLEKTAKSDSFFRYVAGSALQLYKNGGIKIKITKMDLPIAKGLASSATICALVATAYNKVYKLNYNSSDIMRFAYLGEIVTGSKCGRGDQIGAYSGTEKIFKLVFNNENVDVTPIKIKSKFHYLIADVKGKKDTAIICRDLQDAFLKSEEVRNFLEKDNSKLSLECQQALMDGDLEKLGSVMKTSMKLFDEKMAPHCWEQLKGPKLHAIAEDPFVVENSYGAKGTGAQGDGCIQILCKNMKSLKLVKEYLSDKYKLDDFEVLVLKP